MWGYLADHECHACGASATGYQMGELMVEHGWRLHSTGLGKPFFVMCADCVTTYGETWEILAALRDAENAGIIA